MLSMNTLSLFPDLGSDAVESTAPGNIRTNSRSNSRSKRQPTDDALIKLDPHMHIAKRLADELAERHRRAQYRSPGSHLSRSIQTPKSNRQKGRSNEADKVVVAICEHLRASLRDQIKADCH